MKEKHFLKYEKYLISTLDKSTLHSFYIDLMLLFEFVVIVTNDPNFMGKEKGKKSIIFQNWVGLGRNETT